MILSNFPGGGKPQSILDRISYTGAMLYELKFMGGILYHLFALESSGTLTVTGTFTGDVCVIGGGGSGSNKRGGGGGYVNNYTNVSLSSGVVTVGAGATSHYAQAGTTSAFGKTAAGGYGGDHSTSPASGGCGGGGGAYGSYAPGTGQGTTTRPFGSADMRPQAGGGGGPSDGSNGRGGNGGSNGGSGAAAGGSGTTPGSGGAYGGGGGVALSTGGQWNGGTGGINGSDGSAGTGYKGTGGGFGYGGGSGAGTGAAAAGQPGTPGAVMIRIPA